MISAGLLVIVALWILLGVFAGAIAARRGRSRERWTTFGVLFGPAALLISLLTPRIQVRCPYCAEFIRVEAILCRFCGQSLADSSAVDTDESESSGQVVCSAEEMDAHFLRWLTDRQVEVDQLPDAEIAKYRTAFDEALREAMQAQTAS